MLHQQYTDCLFWLQTGTLTENRMTVVEGWFAGTKYDAVPQPQSLPASFFSMFQANVAVNSSVSHATTDTLPSAGQRVSFTAAVTPA